MKKSQFNKAQIVAILQQQQSELAAQAFDTITDIKVSAKDFSEAGKQGGEIGESGIHGREQW